jgi:hypothetical protein
VRTVSPFTVRLRTASWRNARGQLRPGRCPLVPKAEVTEVSYDSTLRDRCGTAKAGATSNNHLPGTGELIRAFSAADAAQLVWRRIMTTLKTLAIVTALLAGGTTLSMAHHGEMSESLMNWA